MSLPSLQAQLVELLHHCCELERTSLDHELAATLAGIQLSRREGVVDELLKQNTGLVELFEQHRVLMEGGLLTHTLTSFY